MVNVAKHPTFAGVTSETNPNLINADGTWKTPETNPGLFKKDGTPRAYVDPATRTANAKPRRSTEEMLAHYEGKLESRKADHAKEIAGIEKKIAYFKNGGGGSRGVDPIKANAAAHELLGKGLTPEQIVAFAEQARLAVAALKGKSEEEIKALAAPPAFLSVTPVPIA